MGIMELGAIGELVGGLAVIGSLIFVGIQLRTTTRTLRAQSSYEAISKINERTDRLISDPKLASIVSNFEDDGAVEVDESSAAQFRYFSRSVFLQWSAQQFLHNQGMLEDAYWQQNLEYARRLVHTEWGSDWWSKDQHAPVYPPDFVRSVNGEG